MNRIAKGLLGAQRRLLSLAVNPNSLRLRVGRITDVQLHPDAEKLFVSQVSLGGDESVQVCSGLVGLVERDQLLNSDVVLACNLKPRKMRGVQSQGMLMCVEKVLPHNQYEVRPILAPENACAGDQLTFRGAEPLDQWKNLKSKTWDAIAPHLRSNPHGTVVFTKEEEGTKIEFPLVLQNAEKEIQSTVSPGFENCIVR